MGLLSLGSLTLVIIMMSAYLFGRRRIKLQSMSGHTASSAAGIAVLESCYSPAEINNLYYAVAFNTDVDNLFGRSPVDSDQVVSFLSGSDCDSYLPRQPLVLPRLMQAVRNPKADASDLVTILLEDSALTAEVLKMANSPYYRNTNDPIESVESALVLIGANGLRTLMLNAMLRPVFNLSDKVFQRFNQVVWQQAIIAADTAQAYAQAKDSEHDFSAQLLSLMTNMAQIILLRFAREDIAADDYVSLLSLLERYQKPVVLALLRSWNLEEELELVCVDFYDNRRQSDLASAVYFGDCVGRLSQLLLNNMIDRDEFYQQLLMAGMDEALLQRLLPKIYEKVMANSGSEVF